MKFAAITSKISCMISTFQINIFGKEIVRLHLSFHIQLQKDLIKFLYFLVYVSSQKRLINLKRTCDIENVSKFEFRKFLITLWLACMIAVDILLIKGSIFRSDEYLIGSQKIFRKQKYECLHSKSKDIMVFVF